MKISIAQTRPVKGDIPVNMDKHKRFIELASSMKATSIFFPELSLTGYEPELAKSWQLIRTTAGLITFSKLVIRIKSRLGLVFRLNRKQE